MVLSSDRDQFRSTAAAIAFTAAVLLVDDQRFRKFERRHALTNQVPGLLRAESLDQLGVRTAMSRGNDDALGPCVDERAATANTLHPDAIVSIDADGGPPSGRGFHVNYSVPPLNQIQAGRAVQFAQIMRDQLRASGIPPANYIGQDGLYGRADLAALNLAQYPAILVELGNMKNPADDALITTPDGRQKYAAAVVNGIAGFLATTKAV